MSTRNSLDRESFERFLANAVAVQECGLDTRSLSAIVEIQQFIASDEFALDRVMQMIVDHLIKLVRASGTAIALLDSNELVSRAGAGSATKDLGRRVAAVLTLCSSHNSRKEILRVENAKTDTRIEAEICRQFGANSLLMLPICENQALVGVLQVRFDDAHSFTQREIRVCSLMIGALEEGILRRQHRSNGREVAGAVEHAPYEQVSSHRDLQAAEGAVNPMAIPADAVVHDISRRQNLTNKGSLFSCQSMGNRKAASRFTSLRTALSPTSNKIRKVNIWRVGTVLNAVALLGIIAWVSKVTHPPAATKGPSVSTQLGRGQPAHAESLSANDPADLSITGQGENTKPRPGFRRVQIGPNEVDYMAEDVTIRKFRISPAKPQLRGGVKEANLGDDVTVRYFAHAAPPMRQPTGTPQTEPGIKHPLSSPR